MSSIYPILGNRPIDQWKVTELKEELKRRKMTTKGLKDDLIRRLEEAISIDLENSKMVEDNGLNCGSQPAVVAKDAQAMTVAAETVNYVASHCGNKNNKPGNVVVQVGINDILVAAFEQQKDDEHGLIGATDSSRMEEELLVHTAAFESSIKVPDIVVSEVAFSVQDIETQKENKNSKPQLDNEYSKPQLENEDSNHKHENEDSMPQLENEDSKLQLENEDSKLQLENQGLKLSSEDVMLNCSTPDNQVSEVSPLLGSQVKSDSISTDSVSLNENIELKDNVITDHVKLELDIVKTEMVEPSSSNVVPFGESY